MKTEYKNITYREDKKLFCVKIRIKGKQVARTAKTIEEAIEIRTELYNQNSIGIYITEEEKPLVTFNDYYDDFVEQVKAGLKPSTYHKYLLTGKSIAQYVGHEALKDLGVMHWKKVISHFEDEGYSARYIKDKMRRVSILYRHYDFSDNPVEKILSKKKIKGSNSRPKNNRRAFTDDEIARFKAVLNDGGNKYPLPVKILFELYFATGCRRAELPALTWDDVDKLNSYIVISKSINKGIMTDGSKSYKEIIGDTKTHSTRLIPISKRLMDNLLSLREYDGYYYNDSNNNFVFKPITPYHKYPWLSISSIQRLFDEIRKASGIGEDLTLHCIRHTWASNLIANGVDVKTVQELGGWSTPRVLMEIYAHAKMDNKVKAANIAESFY